MLKTPIVIVNFKAYRDGTAKNAVKLARICETVAKKTKASIAVAVQTADINAVSKAVSIPVLAQHIDFVEYGANTGSVTADCVKANGAVGTLLNHSERPLSIEEIKKTIRFAKKKRLVTVLCAPDSDTASIISLFGPDFIAVEPPELIGGYISVTSAKPEIITDIVKNVVKGVVCLVGAGVKKKKDVKKSIKLGTRGVLVASGVVKAKNPEKVLTNLVEGLSR